jgi:hypothetical protein
MVNAADINGFAVKFDAQPNYTDQDQTSDQN